MCPVSLMSISHATMETLIINSQEYHCEYPLLNLTSLEMKLEDLIIICDVAYKLVIRSFQRHYRNGIVETQGQYRLNGYDGSNWYGNGFSKPSNASGGETLSFMQLIWNENSVKTSNDGEIAFIYTNFLLGCFSFPHSFPSLRSKKALK